MHSHTRGPSSCRRTPAYPAGRASVQRPSHRPGPALPTAQEQLQPPPQTLIQNRRAFFISLRFCAEYLVKASPPGNELRILALMYSLDTVNWLQAGYIAMSRNPLEAYS